MSGHIRLGDVTPSTLADEAEIVWLEDCQRMPYVREAVTEYAKTRMRKPLSFKSHDGRLVAYAVLKASAKSDEYYMFTRRYWWIASHDPYRGGPMEAVDPASVQAGQHSRYPKEPSA